MTIATPEGRVSASELERLAAKLSKAQRAWFDRPVFRMGNPVAHIPTINPAARDATWRAIKRLGLIEHGKFGQQLTPLGLALRAHILDRTTQGPSKGDAGNTRTSSPGDMK